MKILYIENHEAFISVVRNEFLSEYDVYDVPTVAKAIDAFNKEEFDIVLSDYDLDDGKGCEVIKHIRKNNQKIPIIAVSSHEEGNAKMLQVGANVTCSKMQFKNINNVIQGVLKNAL